jgi:hypothetical protein
VCVSDPIPWKDHEERYVHQRYKSFDEEWREIPEVLADGSQEMLSEVRKNKSSHRRTDKENANIVPDK